MDLNNARQCPNHVRYVDWFLFRGFLIFIIGTFRVGRLYGTVGHHDDIGQAGLKFSFYHYC